MKTSDILGPIIVAVIFALPITIFSCVFYYRNYYNSVEEPLLNDDAEGSSEERPLHHDV